MAELGKRVSSAQRKDLKGLVMSEWDRKNIGFLIAFYEKAYPGVIRQVATEARKDIIKERKLKYAATKTGIQTGVSALNMSRRMAIPQGLYMELKRAYPAIMADNGQFEQFLKWFPVFDLKNV